MRPAPRSESRSYTQVRERLHAQSLTKGKNGDFSIIYVQSSDWTNAALVVTTLAMDFSPDSVLREALMDAGMTKTPSVSTRLWAKVPLVMFLVAAVILVGSLSV